MPAVERSRLLRLTLAGLEELRQFPTVEARHKALDEIASSFKWWEDLLGIVTVGSAAIGLNVALKALIRWLLPNMGRLMDEITDAIRLFVVIGGALLVLAVLHRWGIRHELRRKLIESGVPVCVKCGYSLRGLAHDATVCPECGHQIGPLARALLEDQPAGQS